MYRGEYVFIVNLFLCKAEYVSEYSHASSEIIDVLAGFEKSHGELYFIHLRFLCA